MYKTEPEDQVVHAYQQERCNDTDLDRVMCQPARGPFEARVKIKEIDAAIPERAADESVRKMVYSRSDTRSIDSENTHQP